MFNFLLLLKNKFVIYVIIFVLCLFAFNMYVNSKIKEAKIKEINNLITKEIKEQNEVIKKADYNNNLLIIQKNEQKEEINKILTKNNNFNEIEQKINKIIHFNNKELEKKWAFQF